MNALASGIKKGFTFLELMVVILILGIIATIAVPALQNRLPGYQRKQFIAEVDSLSRLAWQEALVQQKALRLLFTLDKRLMSVQIATGGFDKDGNPTFAPVDIPYLKSSYQWPDSIEIKQFFIGKKDFLTRPGIKTETIWFYYAPEGLVQPVIINMLDTSNQDAQGKARQISLVMNPFTGQFKEYEEFQKP
ncbi:MAG: Tfp pilus assembly protein FimT/FimU [Candidatus Babeliales bacterium]